MGICNAGHPAPLVVREGAVKAVGNSDLPIGLFGNETFALTELSLASGDGLVIYSDGVSEAIRLVWQRVLSGALARGDWPQRDGKRLGDPGGVPRRSGRVPEERGEGG